MEQEYWQFGWQENAFSRTQAFITASPAWFSRVTPADVAEDAYLLALASSLFLRDEVGAHAPGAPTARVPAAPPAPAVRPVAVPPFSYQRCLGNPAEGTTAFAQAGSGAFGSFHQAAAARSGSADAWLASLGALYQQRALLNEYPAETPGHVARLRNPKDDLTDCGRAVWAKTLHAFRIGFGLWGRWEVS